MIGHIGRHNEHMAQTLSDRRATVLERKDADGDGSLSAEEMQKMTDRVKEQDGKSFSPGDFALRLDLDGDSGVTAEDVVAAGENRTGPWWVGQDRHHPGRSRHSARALGRIDTDRSGELSFEEVDDLLQRIAERTGRELDSASIFGAADGDENGVLSREEAKALHTILGPPGRFRRFGLESMSDDAADGEAAGTAYETGAVESGAVVDNPAPNASTVTNEVSPATETTPDGATATTTEDSQAGAPEATASSVPGAAPTLIPNAETFAPPVLTEEASLSMEI